MVEKAAATPLGSLFWSRETSSSGSVAFSRLVYIISQMPSPGFAILATTDQIARGVFGSHFPTLGIRLWAREHYIVASVVLLSLACIRKTYARSQMAHLHGEDPPWPPHVFAMGQESKHKQLPQTRRLKALTRGLPTLGISYRLDEKELAV